MRRLAPFLTLALVIAGFWWALEDAPTNRKPDPRRGVASAPAAEPASPPAESRPESAPALAPESQPESGAESQPESAPVEAVVVVEVVREDGRPVAQARVQLKGDDPREFATGEDGRAEFPARAGVTVDAHVEGPDFGSVDTTVLLDSGTRQVVVPTGSSVAGRVTVDGKAPGEPIPLELYERDPNDPEGSLSRYHTWTDLGGRFEFFNLAPTWRGHLDCSSTRGFTFAEHGRDTWDLPGPNPALELKLHEAPVIKGRVVTRGTREPCTGAILLKIDADFGSGEVQTETSQSFTSNDGRFRLSVEENTRRVVLEVSDSNRLGTRTIEVPGPFDVVRDLGEIELAKIRQITFRVRDAESRPVAGALGAITDTWVRSEPTDDDGRAAINTDTGARELRVGKLGYATAIVPVAEDAPIPIEVELKRGNKLVIDAKLPDGTAPRSGSVSIVLRSDGPMFTGPKGMSDSVLTKTGATEPLGEDLKSTGPSSIVFFPNDAGRIVVGGFRPGAAVAVQLRGQKLGDTLAEDFVIMAAEDTKTLTLRAPHMPQIFAGIIRTPEGNPIDGASVLVSLPGNAGDGLDFGSDPEGRFALDYVFADRVDVALSKEGFVPLRLGDIPVTGSERAFTLVPTRKITVVLVDEEGRPIVPEATITIWLTQDLESSGKVEDLGRGVYLVEGVPPSPVEIQAVVGTSWVLVPHDGRTPLARILIPTEGTAELHWRRDARDPARCRIRIDIGPIPFLEVDVPEEIGDHWLDAKAPPGVYVATVEAWDEDAGEWYAIGATHEFEIAAYLATSVELGR
jgi:hypothetical protein